LFYSYTFCCSALHSFPTRRSSDLDHFFIINSDCAAVRFAKDFQNQEIADCFWNAQTGCNRARIRKFCGGLFSPFECADDRRATDSLYCEHPWPLSPDPAERFQFIECFPHSDEARAAAGGIKNGVGQLPVALLC